MEIVQMTSAHVAAVAEMEKLCFSDPWSENSVASELTNPLSLWLVAVDENRVVGYIGSQSVLDGADMMNVAVHPDCRRRGIGRALIERLVAELKKIPGFTTLVLSVNKEKGNTILGSEFIPLFGPGYIEDTLCGLHFRLSARSFYQVNHHQAQRLYEAAIAQAEITKEDTVLDLYCGVGTITLCMAKAAGQVLGVEVIPQAVEDARDNARRNGIENARFFCGDAGQAALELEQSGIRADVVVVDPPRKGLNGDTIEALSRFAPRRIVYVSCDPATLARDVALLKERGYRVKNAMAADLFPRCAHVETVVLLSRKDVYERIKFDVNVEDLQGRASSTATYSEIKAYILEKYGLKVSSLYIAQIKDKCGFEKRDNYNIGEGKSKELICPPEKEQAIMDAFRHFGMLRD